MENQLSPETLAEVDALVRKISVAHHLDTDIRGELRTHIEDKLHAYLTGELAPSQSDAVILAKAHFGDPAAIQFLLARAHRQDRTLRPRRRLIALALSGSLLVASALFVSHWLESLSAPRNSTSSSAIVFPEGITLIPNEGIALIPMDGKLVPKIVLPSPDSCESTLPKGAQKRRFNGRTFYIIPLQT